MMAQRDRVEVGKATNLHYTGGRAHYRHAPKPHGRSSEFPKLHTGGPRLTHRSDGAHVGHGGWRGPRRPRGRGGAAALAVIALFAVLLCGAVVGGWYFMLRDITVTVNGEPVTARVNTPLPNLLSEHDYFGAKPGRLLSVGGNVLDEEGGVTCTVTRGDAEATGDAAGDAGDAAGDAVADQAAADGSTDDSAAPAEDTAASDTAADTSQAPTGDTIDERDFAKTLLHDGDVFTVTNGVDTDEPSHEEEAELAPAVQRERGGAVQFVSQWGKAGKKTVRVGERSGERVDVAVIESATDMVVSSINLEPAGGPYAALTFDDGPSSYTPQILEILKEKKVPATFFNLGNQAAKDPDGCRAIVDAGCELASHTNAHQNLPTLDRESLRAEISSAADTLEQASGTRPQMIRAPYGAFTETEWGRAGDLISANVLWNIDTLDWKRPGVETITNAVLDNVENGSIILMHDGGGNREQDVEALPGIIDGLKERGYTLVTVSELMKLDGRVPEEVIEGTVKMPEDAAMPEG